MRIFKNKKALDYAILLMVVVLICMGFLFWNLIKKTGSIERDVGDYQIGLMNARNNADSMLFYLDQSGKYAAYEAAELLGKQGGFVNESQSCGGSQNNYISWNNCANATVLCFPDLISNFNELMSQKLGFYLFNFKGLYDGSVFINNNYIFTLHDKKITGTAIRDIDFNIAPYQSQDVYSAGRYSFKPSFSVDFNYDFSNYFKMKSIIESCLIQPDLGQCITSKLDSNTTVRISGDYMLFDVGQQEFSSPYSQNPLPLRFALCTP